MEYVFLKSYFELIETVERLTDTVACVTCKRGTSEIGEGLE